MREGQCIYCKKIILWFMIAFGGFDHKETVLQYDFL